MASLLIVDDERHTRNGLQTLLSRGEDVVETAASGEEALVKLAAQDIDIVLSDVKMLGMDGLALLRQIKARHTGVVVVMMSAHNDVTAALPLARQCTGIREHDGAGGHLDPSVDDARSGFTAAPARAGTRGHQSTPHYR